jgi:L,D-peptidoglycan transpeptidase YkuD (ErfK/YbiS/YcfS/YnhG family)
LKTDSSDVRIDNKLVAVTNNKLQLPSGRTFRCALGRGGLSDNKVEGDGSTPTGTFPIRRVFYRPDRLAKPDTQLNVVAMKESDAWIDQPGHPNYNQLAIVLSKEH